MKSYRITDDFKIVRYGNRLRFEIADAVVDDIADDDVAKIIDLVIDARTGRMDDYMSFSFADSGEKYVMIEYYPAGDEGLAEIRLYIEESFDDERATKDSSVRLVSGWQWTKLADVLTHVLPRLCEEGC